MNTETTDGLFSDSTMEPFDDGWMFTPPGAADARPVMLPHAWNAEGWSYEAPRPAEPAGTGVYRKTLRGVGKGDVLKFEGVALSCRVQIWSMGNELIVACERDRGLGKPLFDVLEGWIAEVRKLSAQPVIANSNGDAANLVHKTVGDIDDIHQYGGWYTETLYDLRHFADCTLKNDMLFQPAISTESIAAYTNDDGEPFVRGNDVRQRKVVDMRIWDTFREVLGPVHVQLECFDRHVYAGASIRGTLRLYHVRGRGGGTRAECRGLRPRRAAARHRDGTRRPGGNRRIRPGEDDVPRRPPCPGPPDAVRAGGGPRLDRARRVRGRPGAEPGTVDGQCLRNGHRVRPRVPAAVVASRRVARLVLECMRRRQTR